MLILFYFSMTACFATTVQRVILKTHNKNLPIIHITKNIFFSHIKQPSLYLSFIIYYHKIKPFKFLILLYLNLFRFSNRRFYLLEEIYVANVLIHCC